MYDAVYVPQASYSESKYWIRQYFSLILTAKIDTIITIN
jgi:hypothetical protein